MATSAEPLPESPQELIVATYPEPLSPILSAPRHVAFRGANNKYLGWTKGGFLKFTYDDLTSPFVKHQVVNEESVNGESYVHIKCCFNQKFWRRQDANSWLIVAAGQSPNRDRSSWSCTLFDRVYDQDNVQSSVRLQLLQSSKPLAVYGADIDQDNSLFAQADDLNQTAYALQAVSLDLLPEIFALQLSNGIFLAASRYGRFDYLRFNNTDIGSSAIRHQVMHRQADGTMAVKSLGFNAFWENRSMTPDRILGSASVYNSSQRSMLFRPLQVDRERVAILNVGRNLFCRRTGDGSTSDNYFSPMASTLEDIVLLKVREPVISRSVRTVVYDLANIEIYDKRPLLAATVVATNKTTTTHTVLLNLTRKVKNSRTWSNSVSFTTGIKVSFTMGIPSIGQSGVEVSNSRTTTQEWDETEEEEITLGGQYEYTVDPGEMLTVNLHATQGKFSLKFSYVQEDLRSTGERVTDSKNDGLFTGINYFDVHTEHSSKPINT